MLASSSVSATSSTLRVGVRADELADAFDHGVYIDFFIAAFGFVRRQSLVDVGSGPAQRLADDFTQRLAATGFR